MKLQSNLVRLSLLLLFAISIQSCFIGKAIETGKAKKEFTVENEAIPPDFAQNDEVVLFILRGRRSYDKWVKKGAKRYGGNYELIKRNDLMQSKYDDKTKYRYVFDYSNGTSRTSTNMSTNLSSTITYKRYYIQDRLADKSYQSGAEFTFFAKALRVYVDNMEAKRLSAKQ